MPNVAADPVREALGPPRGPLRAPANPTSSTSTCTSCTRSRRRRRSTACAWPGRRVRRPDLTVATMDHNVPTADLDKPLADPISAKQMDVLARNCAEFGIRLYGMRDPGPGHRARHRPRAGPHAAGHDDRVRRQPHVDARRVRRARVRHRHERGRARARHADAAADAAGDDGDHRRRRRARRACRPRTSCSRSSPAIGTGGGIGSVIEYRGSAIRNLSMEGRMTVCNMSIEAGARAGLVAPDDTTFAYLEGRPFAPKGAEWERALDDWRTLVTDADAAFDKEVFIDAATLRPHVSWGTNPAQTIPIDASVPDPDAFADESARESAKRALVYMGLKAGTPMRDIAVDTVFIGSCTNSRIEDLRVAADVARGRKVKAGVRTLVVPGSYAVKVAGRGRRARPRVPRRGLRLARAGLLDVPGDEPRQARARRALRVDVEPQLRRPPGQGRPHAPRLPRRRGRHRDRRPLLDSGGPELMEQVRVITGRGVPLVRSDVDTDQIIPSDWLKRVERTGFGEGLFSEWRENSDFVLNQARYDGANDPRRRPELRHRLVARARGVGADGLRLPGRAVDPLRRHLPQQLREDGPRRRRGSRSGDPPALGGDRRGPEPRDRRSTSSTSGSRRRPSTST